MIFQTSVLFLTVFLASCASASEGDCPGGVSNGATTERGRYWYECRRGQLVPKGCLAESNGRISIGETYDSNSYRMQCVEDRDGYLTIVFKSCVYNGREYTPGEQWDDVKYAYACTKEGDQLRIEVAGCIDQGRRVGINDKVTRGSFVYQCLKTKNGTCSMCPIGCTKDNREYGLGETFERGDFWYTCIRDPDNNRKIAVKPSGCMYQGRRMQDQERFRKQEVLMQCSARDGEAKATAIGCVSREDQREVTLGDTWTEGRAPYRYEMVCKARDSESTFAQQKRCVYEVYSGQYEIDAGCYQIVDQTSAIGCTRSGGDRLEIRAFRLEDIERGSLRASGLRLC